MCHQILQTLLLPKFRLFGWYLLQAYRPIYCGSANLHEICMKKYNNLFHFSFLFSAEPPHVVLDPSLGPLGRQDPRFPLPGNVGFANNLYPKAESISAGPSIAAAPDVLTRETSDERHSIVFGQFICTVEDVSEFYTTGFL